MTNPKPENDVLPSDCFARASLIAAEVELIRQEMGRPEERRPPVVVKGAAPRECYFQALALFHKADRLCHETTGDGVAAIPHTAPIVSLRPAHVLAVLDAALRELTEVKARLGISEKSAAPASDLSKTPSDVFGVMATTNRKLNLLLARGFSPGDVYQQVNLAVAYAARLLETRAASSPGLPAFERRKRPADCFDRLRGCLDTLKTIARAAGLPILDQGITPGDAADVLPSDVYDQATLVLAELAFLHAQQADANPPYPFEANAPGRKLPAHVFQLAGLLDAQLALLARK